MAAPAGFGVISGGTVQEILAGRYAEIVTLVERVYRAHHAGRTRNPHSQFLRFADRPDNRIIALPASLGPGFDVDGLKWISSVPGNTRIGLPRASAVLILNDQRTGFPVACMEGSVISATRTAASAALAADRLCAAGRRPDRVSYLGTGLIAEYIHRFLTGTGWTFAEVGLYDLRSAAAHRFAEEMVTGPATVHRTAEAAVRNAGLVVFATTAARPHVTDPAWFGHHPAVLHISLRDLGPEVILAAANVVDDVDHCLRAATSPHLAEQHSGSRSFIAGTLGDVLCGRPLPTDRPVIFSPFGLGVFDLAVADYVHRAARGCGRVLEVADFFPRP